MHDSLKVHIRKEIHAPVDKVWRALTDPGLIKQYLFNTNTITNWKKGSVITWTGVHEGRSYQDKGTIIDMIPEKKLHTTHYSPLSGKEDKQENYHNVIYELEPGSDRTIITLTQDNVTNEKELQHLQRNWNMVLDRMKKLLEEGN